VHFVLFSESQCTGKGKHVATGILVKNLCSNAKILRKFAQATMLQITTSTQCVKRTTFWIMTREKMWTLWCKWTLAGRNKWKRIAGVSFQLYKLFISVVSKA